MKKRFCELKILFMIILHIVIPSPLDSYKTNIYKNDRKETSFF